MTLSITINTLHSSNCHSITALLLLSWMSLMPSVAFLYRYSECHCADCIMVSVLCWVYYAECIMLSVLCWVYYAECIMLSVLCWMSLRWVPLCRVSLCWLSLCWVSLCWMSSCWVAWRLKMWPYLSIFYLLQQPVQTACSRFPRKWRRRKKNLLPLG